MAKKNIILCDINIIIELFKNNLKVIEVLENIGLDRIAVSAISAGEFIFGALNKSELSEIMEALDSIYLVQVNEMISKHGLELIEEYSLTHHLNVPDAIYCCYCNLLQYRTLHTQSQGL